MIIQMCKYVDAPWCTFPFDLLFHSSRLSFLLQVYSGLDYQNMDPCMLVFNQQHMSV